MDDKNNMFFLEVLGNIDDRFIVEVENNWSSHKRYILWKKIALAAIATIFIGVIVVNSNEVVVGLEKFISIISRVFNIKEDISSYSQIIDKTITQNGISVTLNEVIVDTDKMIVSYEIVSESNLPSDPLLWGDVWINGKQINAYDSYSEENELLDEYTGKVIVYHFEENTLNFEENEITILLYPEDLDTGYKYGEFKYEFEASLEDMKMELVDIPLYEEIVIEENSILYLRDFSFNLIGSKITGICDNLPSVYEKYTVVFYLKGIDDLGNEVSYRLRNYSNPNVSFEMEMKESYISPLAKSLTLQLYGKLLSNSSGDKIEFYDEGKDLFVTSESYDYELNSYLEYTENPFELFEIGNPIKIQIKEKE